MRELNLVEVENVSGGDDPYGHVLSVDANLLGDSIEFGQEIGGYAGPAGPFVGVIAGIGYYGFVGMQEMETADTYSEFSSNTAPDGETEGVNWPDAAGDNDSWRDTGDLGNDPIIGGDPY